MSTSIPVIQECTAGLSANYKRKVVDRASIDGVELLDLKHSKWNSFMSPTI